MKKTFTLIIMAACFLSITAQDLIITAAFDGPLSGGTPKGVELYVVNDIADLSIYGLGSANNGGGTDNQEFTFDAVSATAGSYIYVASEAPQFTTWFGFAPDYTSGAMGINGDDAVELFKDGTVVDVFGDINTDGTGQPWEHLDSWAYRVSGTGPDGSTFTLANWTFGGPNALDGESTNATAATPVPVGTYTAAAGNAVPSVTSITLSPATPLASNTVSVSADITDADGTITNVVLSWGTASGNLTNTINMSVSSGDTYVTDSDIPAQTAFTTVYYQIVATDDNSESNNPSEKNYTVAKAVTIQQVQYTAGAGPEGTYPSLYEGKMVQTNGIVTAVDNSGFYMQDGDGDETFGGLGWNGVWVYTQSAPSVAEGDDVTVTGEVVEYKGLTEIAESPVVVVNSSGNTLPTRNLVVHELTEKDEGVLSFISFGTITNADLGYGEFEISIGGTKNFPIVIDDKLYDANPVAVDAVYSITGVVTYNFDTYKILPRKETDVVEETATSTANIAGLNKIYGTHNAIMVEADNAAISVFSLDGKMMYQGITSSDVTEIKVANKGIYFVQVKQNNSNITTKVLVK